MSNTSAPPKKKKSQGPIRFEAIIPFTIIVALIWAYFALFFDTHARIALQKLGTDANGAEVNIGHLKTSFFNASLEIQKIQLTNPDRPTHNALEIGAIKWKMSWDALLRAKVAIDEASILNIALGTKRTSPGYVVPPPPPSNEPSAADKLKAQALQAAEDKFKQNVLGDAAALLSGADPSQQLKNIQDSLKSQARIKELQDELAKKQKEWDERIAKLPKSEELKDIEKRAKSIKLDGFSNPAELQQSVQQIEALVKDVDDKVKNVKATGDAVGSDLKTWQANINQLKDFVEKDIADLKSRFKIPQLDAKSLAMSIFGPMFLGKVRQYEAHFNKAKEYLPPPKTPEEKAAYKPKPKERTEGRTYAFGRPKSYPLFWLKHAAISSKASPEGTSGDLKGELKHVSTDQRATGHPTTLNFEGAFPSAQVFDVNGLLTLDHRTTTPEQSLVLKVGRFAVGEMKLVQSPEVNLALKEASGSSQINLRLKGGELNMKLDNTFSKVAYDTQAQQPIVQEILQGALADVPTITLNAQATGEWTAPQFDIRSNLGDALQAGFQKQLQAKINEAQAKLKAMVDEAIGKERTKLTSEFDKTKGELDKVMKAKQAEIDKLKADLEKKKNQAIADGQKKLQNEGQKAVDELKKRFGL
ncbi:MAG TPA: TIGR03545 family protein [Pseudobdellovibrionaceae bacterium]|nr:TIGR03545 family protein [Pseudobdellovibrionaceae bacterium]